MVKLLHASSLTEKIFHFWTCTDGNWRGDGTPCDSLYTNMAKASLRNNPLLQTSVWFLHLVYNYELICCSSFNHKVCFNLFATDLNWHPNRGGSLLSHCLSLKNSSFPQRSTFFTIVFTLAIELQSGQPFLLPIFCTSCVFVCFLTQNWDFYHKHFLIFDPCGWRWTGLCFPDEGTHCGDC